jgi:hypothetical protein
LPKKQEIKTVEWAVWEVEFGKIGIGKLYLTFKRVIASSTT